MNNQPLDGMNNAGETSRPDSACLDRLLRMWGNGGLSRTNEKHVLLKNRNKVMICFPLLLISTIHRVANCVWFSSNV